MNSVLYVVEDEKAVQYRYRVQNVAAEYNIKVVLKSALGSVNLEGVNLIVIERQTAKNNTILKFIKKAKRQGICVLFDLDDLVFDYKYLSLIRSVAGKSYLYWLGYFWGIRRIAKRVDGFIVTNDFLGERIKKTFKKPYKVIRNSINKEQIEHAKKITKKNDKKFIIGYFSGSPTHKKDFELIQPELIRFLDEHEDAEIKVVGYMDFNKQAQKYIDAGRIKVTRPVNYLKLLDLMAEVDVNIAPLVINDFTNCKSELKFFEAAIVETTTIASPSFTFKKAIKDGKNGYLANPGEWYGKLEYLYKHPEDNKKIAKVAREDAVKHYYGDEFRKEIEEAYDYFTN